MTADTADIELINLNTLEVVMTDGEVLPIVDWADANGDECDIFNATQFQAGRDGYGWIVGDIVGKVMIQ